MLTFHNPRYHPRQKISLPSLPESKDGVIMLGMKKIVIDGIFSPQLQKEYIRIVQIKSYSVSITEVSVFCMPIREVFVSES